MRERLTARVLLFDADMRLLLMRGRLAGRPPETAAWFTVGGGVDPGETLAQAALREIEEETGFTEVELGPLVWTRLAEGPMPSGERVRFVESYLVARCPGGDPCRDAWAEHEVQLIDDIRWWSLADILASKERMYPERLRELLPDVAAGVYPQAPLEITVPRA